MRICDLPGIHFLPFNEKWHQCRKKAYTATDVLMLISRIALTVLAAITSLTLFTPAFAAGIGWGLYKQYSPSNAHHHHHHDPASALGCGEFFQSLANMEFPAEFTCLASLCVTIAHLDHHPYVFVPYCGIAIGMWVGQISAPQIKQAVSWIRAG